MCVKAIPDFLLSLSTLCSELTAPFRLQILVPVDPPPTTLHLHLIHDTPKCRVAP